MPFQSLPAEIIDWIAECTFTPARLVPPVTDWRENPEDPEPDDKARRATLAALARTCRMLYTVANPLLYHTLYIDNKSFVAIRKRLTEHERLRDAVRVLDIAVVPDTRAGAEPGWPYRVKGCASVISLVENLNALHVHYPSRLLEGDISKDPFLCARTIDRLMGAAKNIRHLELRDARLNGAASFHAAAWHQLATIKALDSVITGTWLYGLCAKAKARLRIIDISTPHTFHPPMEKRDAVATNAMATDRKYGPGFNGVLKLCASSLEYLRLNVGWLPDHTWQLGPAKRLTSLRSMKKLKYLEAEPAVVFSSLRAMRNADICDFLPSSLETVRFIDEVWCGRGQDVTEGVEEEEAEVEEAEAPVAPRVPDLLEIGEHSKALRRAMLQLVLHSEQKLPLLRRVEIQYDEWTDDREEYWVLDEEKDIQGLYTIYTDKTGTYTVISCVPLQARK